MKIIHPTIIAVLLVVTTQVWAGDETPKKSKAKRQVYNYNSESNYQCTNAPACLPLSRIPNQTPGTFTDVTWVNKTTVFYITMSTCWGYDFVAQILLGRKPFSYREVEEMCPAQFFGSSGNGAVGSVVTRGSGVQFYQDCEAIGDICAVNCTSLPSDPGVDCALQVWEADYHLLSDGMSYILAYRCIDGRHGDFQLYTTRPYLEQSLVTKVMDMVVNKLEFSPNDVKILPCYFPTYPVPLQNYPEPDSALSESCPSYQHPFYSPPPPQPAPTTEPVHPPHYNHPAPHHPY